MSLPKGYKPLYPAKLPSQSADIESTLGAYDPLVIVTDSFDNGPHAQIRGQSNSRRVSSGIQRVGYVPKAGGRLTRTSNQTWKDIIQVEPRPEEAEYWAHFTVTK